jgi:tetratricopeptide (TPR) repeat protein
VTLLGVPGIGKSRLVWELFSELERETDLRYWRQGRSLPYGQGVSLWALAEMIKAQAGVLEGDDDDAVGAKLDRAVREVVPEEEAEWVSASLRPLVGLETLGDAGGTRGASRDEAFTAWRRFVESLAERYPIVLVFEDLHWADDTLLNFIDHLVDWARDVPILVLCTARPELLERRPGWGGGKSNALTLRLTALSDADSAQILSNALGTPVLAAETQQLLLERASGNPLYAEQFARLLVERGSAQDLPLPDSVQGLIAARLDTLSVAEKALLQDAWVMGKVFWSGALAGDGDRAGLLHALDRKEFIRRERRSSVSGQDEYAFRHVLVRDVAYEQIPKADRAAKHLRAAEWIDSLGRPQDHAELVAHHYRSAMQLNPAPLPAHLVDRARTALQDAGDRSFALGSFAGAVGYYRAALELMEADDPNRPTALFGLGRAQFRATGSGADTLAAAVDALVAAGDPETAAEAETLLTTLWWESGKRELWLPHLARAAELVSDAPITPSKAQVVATRARHLYLAGDFRAALPVANEALAMAASVGREDLRAHALNTIAMARWETDAEAGYAAMRESIAISNAINSADAFKGYNNLQVMLEVDGHPREAMDAWRDSVRVAERFGAEGDLRWARHTGVWWAFFTGEWDRALEEIDRFLREAEKGSSHYLIGAQFLNRARIRIARDDLAGAVTDASASLTHARGTMDPQNVVPALALELWIRAELGEAQAAGATLDEMLAGMTQSSAYGFGTAGTMVAWAVASMGRGREWLNVISTGRHTPWIDAASLIIAGDWLAAAEKYAELGSQFDEAFARLRAAEQLAAAGRRAEADQQLDLSLAFFRKVRATRYVAQAEALLSAIA